MSLEDKNYCYIEISDDVDLEQVKYDPNSPPPNIDFVINIHANITQVVTEEKEEEEEEDAVMLIQYETSNFYKSFETQIDLLVGVDDYESYSNVSHMLFDVNVPQEAHQGMIREICNAARSIASAKRNANCSSLAMSVLIEVFSSEEEEPEEDFFMDCGGINEEDDDYEAMLEDDIRQDDIRQGYSIPD